MEHYNVIVVGGGPAGMFAAGFAAQQGARVLLLEKNKRCGAKLLITGKGRCNLTNAEDDPSRFSTAFGVQGKNLLTALYRFDVAATIDFFEQRGLALTRERGGRVFPTREKAAAVQQVLDDFLATSGVMLKNACPVNRISFAEGRVAGLETAAGRFSADAYVAATGGLSYPETGCTGDGFRWAEQSGHRLIAREPALVPVQLREDWTGKLTRLNLKNVRLSAHQENRVIAERFGEAFFTQSGIGGPIILDMSALLRDALKSGPVELQLDFKPAVTRELFDKRLQRELKEHHNKNFANSLGNLLPQALIPVFVQLSGIPPEKKCHSVSKGERQALLQLFKALPLQVTGVGNFRKAIVTSGGVALCDIDMRTMRSKKIDNLYFCGEMIDLDGPTGGYNLQLCWSTGYLAGVSAAAGT
jgi:predicted Rossmann fold flavoprotein